MKKPKSLTKLLELDEEALENASEFAFYLFDRQGWELGELSAEEITKMIIQRYLKISKLTQNQTS